MLKGQNNNSWRPHIRSPHTHAVCNLNLLLSILLVVFHNVRRRMIAEAEQLIFTQQKGKTHTSLGGFRLR